MGKDIMNRVSTTSRHDPDQESQIISGFKMPPENSWLLGKAGHEIADKVLATVTELMRDYKDERLRWHAAQWIIDEIHERARRNIAWTGYDFKVPPDYQEDDE